MGEHRSFPKPPPRLVDKSQAKREAARAWRHCCAVVDQRDQYRCRCCGRRTVPTLAVSATRAEHHHLVSRRLLPKALHMDARVVILTCARCHHALTRHTVRVWQARLDALVIEGERFPNADNRLVFLSSDPCPTPSIESALISIPKVTVMTD